MPTYIALLSFTEKGIANIKDSPARIEAARKAVESVGGKWLSYHVTMGEYDGVATVELPNDEAAAQIVLATAMQGNVRTQTMRAFSEEEFANIVGRLP